MNEEKGLKATLIIMEPEEIEKRIKNFVESDSELYVDFWTDLFPRSLLKSREEVELPKQELIFMDEGVYDNVVELDFTKFSFKNLLRVARQKNINHKIANTIKALTNLLENYEIEPYRFKRLRIYFFECLLNSSCGLYNPTLYKEARENMRKVMDNLEELIKSHNKKIISKMWDSFSFISNKKDGLKIAKENKEKQGFECEVRHFDRIVSFRNINLYKENGSKFSKKTTGTNYDELKNEIVDLLMELEFDKAKELVKNSYIHEKLKGSYLKSLDKMEVNYAGSGE